MGENNCPIFDRWVSRLEELTATGNQIIKRFDLGKNGQA